MQSDYSTPKRATTGLPGVRYGRLVVIGEAAKRSNNRRVSMRCDCGTLLDVFVGNLRRDHTTSCGCRAAELLLSQQGESRSSAYKSWTGMIDRCTNSAHKSYHYYGSKGITVCDRWSGPNGFVSFLADMGQRPEGRSLDRIDNGGDYSPENCKWATGVEQARNKSNNVELLHNGRVQCVAAWSQALGLHVGTLHSRLKRGWSVERALTEPVQKQK